MSGTSTGLIILRGESMAPRMVRMSHQARQAVRSMDHAIHISEQCRRGGKAGSLYREFFGERSPGYRGLFREHSTIFRIAWREPHGGLGHDERFDRPTGRL